MARISRDPADLVAQMVNAHHRYPDGAVLFLGTMFAPVEDRDAPGQGFTHKSGDIVTIAAPKLGRLVNRMQPTDQCEPWTFGAGALMRNLAARGLLRWSRSSPALSQNEERLAELMPRIGRLHVRQRLGMERDFEAYIFRRTVRISCIGGVASSHGLVRIGLRVTGLFERGQRNARRIVVLRADVVLPHLPRRSTGSRCCRSPICIWIPRPI